MVQASLTGRPDGDRFGKPLAVSVAFRAFKQREDRLGVTMTQFKIFLEPGDDFSCLDAGAKLSVLGIGF